MDQSARKSQSRARRAKEQYRNNINMKEFTSSEDSVQNQASIQINEDKIMKIACSYEAYSLSELAPDIVVKKGLRNLDDVIPYGVSAQTQKEYWREEITRLSSAVMEPGCQISFRGTNQLNQLTHKTKDAYEVLMRLADQMFNALNITIHDSQGIISSHFPDLFDRELFSRSQEGLEQFVIVDDDEDNDNDIEDKDNMEHTTEARTQSYGPQANREDYFELVNYLTAILARILCNAASGQQWYDDILANLATMCTKLKVVSFQPKKCAAKSLEINPKGNSAQVLMAPNQGRVGEGAPMARNQNRGEEKEEAIAGHNTPFRDQNKMLDAMNLANKTKNAYLGPRTRRKAVKEQYWIEKMKVKHILQQILQYILASLRGCNRVTATSKTSYELCALVYETYFKESPTLLYQDIDGEYLGISKPEDIGVAHATFEILNSIVKSLEATRDRSGQPRQAFMDEGPVIKGTTISWHYSIADRLDNSQSRTMPNPNNPPRKKMVLESMSEIITIRLPLTLVSPMVVKLTSALIEVCSHTTSLESDKKISLNASPKFDAFFCLSTEEYRDYWSERQHLPVTQLSRTFLAGDAQPLRKSNESALIRPPTTYEPAAGSWAQESKSTKDQETIRKHQQELQAAMEQMKEWTLEEDGVRVHCAWYVWTILTIVTILVLGGIAAGITIHDRLIGVDPFNISTFCWVLAAFILLVAKSVRVANWPWRDFLRRQVLCRSVSELRSVTRIDDQLIIAKLLHDESISRLQTRGPFNCIFSRRIDSADGFSIDQPISIRTMLLSGLIMVLVQSIPRGEFLVCLDLRKGADYEYIGFRNLHHHAEYILSEKLNKKGFHATDSNRVPLNRYKSIGWHNVVGIYSQGECEFT